MSQIIKVTFENVTTPESKPMHFFYEKERLLSGLNKSDIFTCKTQDVKDGKITIVTDELKNI